MSSLRPASSSRFFGSQLSALPCPDSDRQPAPSIAHSRPPCAEDVALRSHRGRHTSPSSLQSSVADPVLPAKIRRLHSGLMLLQHRNDLLFCVPALLHPSPPAQITRELQFSLVELFGGRSLSRSEFLVFHKLTGLGYLRNPVQNRLRFHQFHQFLNRPDVQLQALLPSQE